MSARNIIIVSDGTGITAENFAHSLLAQFDINIKDHRIPFIDTIDKAHQAVQKIKDIALVSVERPMVFTTLVNPEIHDVIHACEQAYFVDLFNIFVAPLELELGLKSNHSANRLHHNADSTAYRDRIEAINFALMHDDGQTNKNLAQADVILVGVSRCGKTPTSLYLAMQHGIKAANCPLIPEDFERNCLPSSLDGFRHKLFGLTIEAARLSEIRNERRPGSKYAALENCRYEVNEAEKLMNRHGISTASSTHKSIEEIATTILQEIHIER
jgi:regulator of PEP synthase PpsR (kinase-PPPase family)